MKWGEFAKAIGYRDDWKQNQPIAKPMTEAQLACKHRIDIVTTVCLECGATGEQIWSQPPKNAAEKFIRDKIGRNIEILKNLKF